MAKAISAPSTPPMAAVCVETFHHTLIYRSNDEKEGAEVYSEKNAGKSGIFIEDGYTLLTKFINNDIQNL